MEGTLVSVLENRPPDTEILVALDRPYADPYDLKGEVRFIDAPAGAGPSVTVNAGLAAARAPFVHLLASGCRVTDGWTERALARFGASQVGAVAPLAMYLDKPERIFAAGVGYRRGGQRYLVGRDQTRLTGEDVAAIVGPCLFAAFYRKSALERAGGLSPQLGLAQADADLGLSLARGGFTCHFEAQSQVLAESDVSEPLGPFRRALYDERLFWRNLPSGSRMGALTAHAAIVAGELLGSLGRPRFIAQLTARFLACCQARTLARAAANPPSIHKKADHSPLDHWRVDRSHSKAGAGDQSKTAAPLR
ncbi:MAG TPA: glycosyltransferase family A protein [Pirellulales bacterium]|nr:glycosyltransferase family A protein [Pirellulales bacterium]